ncbi:MAG: COX15/CtaA family protein, partial [Chloroflexi bacterium]|nr:COX15/CtaA family protein [Chloroflexota bacterium]
MSRFQRLAALTVALTFGLVAIGVAVRATDSGLACPTWPGCFEGRFLPHLSAGWQVWLEWTHRTVAALVGLVILAMAFVAVADHRDRRSLWVPSLAAVALVGFQAWLGRETVRLGNTGESVTAHLAAAMLLVGLLVYLLVRSGFPARIVGRGLGRGQRFTALAAFAAAASFVVMLFGANVTALDAALVFPDWPLMNGSLVPPLSGEVASAHVLHRWVAGAILIVVLGLALGARRLGASEWLVGLASLVAMLYVAQVVVGGLQVLTRLAPWTQTLHVALGALIWGGLVALVVGSWYAARLAASASTDSAAEAAGGASNPSPGDTARAYIALMKPRIIELLLVTTIPAMVLATREVPGMPLLDWGWLAFWTLV